MYKIELSENALNNLKKLDKQIAQMILSWIKKNLENCENPRVFGKGLVADKKSIWRYRIGEYRILTHIFEDRLVVLIVTIGHRKDIYK